jgi:hypothetical protein
MKSTIFWDITPCSPLKINGRFGGTCHFHLQGLRISRARHQYVASTLKCRLTFNGLHGAISQNIELFFTRRHISEDGDLRSTFSSAHRCSLDNDTEVVTSCSRAVKRSAQWQSCYARYSCVHHWTV